ncbi:MAG: hemerythrin domain-containing protein [Sandaracinaceae bacterium]
MESRLGELPAAELVDVLEETLHTRMRAGLARLETLVRGVEILHGLDERYPRGLAGQVEVLSIDLSDHMEKEERVIFPAVRRGLSVELTPPIRVMRREHEDLLESLASIRDATEMFPGPDRADVAPRWQEFRVAFDEFERGLKSQLEIEDRILFPQLCAS